MKFPFYTRSTCIIAIILDMSTLIMMNEVACLEQQQNRTLRWQASQHIRKSNPQLCPFMMFLRKFAVLIMASLRPTLSQLSLSQSNFPRKSSWNNHLHCYFHKRIANLQTFTASKPPTFRVCCDSRDTKNQSNGEEPPESLFMKELKRRGMTPTSLLEDYKQSNYGLDEEVYAKEEDRGFPNRNVVSTNVERSLDNQRERSMALNSEGLEGLIPRAKLLLTLGGTFFLAFWPLILITVASFSALYFYFGPTFVHDASKMAISPPQYVDPYALLEDERISQIAPRLN
ncbi:hypothetical protein VNO77_12343 [Canavalia gladiata]|uniref:Uncharacterized protein n=1 Tax=Canavalia gladiata TaxID=3824 RepID=A0AAN9M1G6_CANGL